MFPARIRSQVDEWCRKADTACSRCEENPPGCCSQIVAATSTEAIQIVYEKPRAVLRALDKILDAAPKELVAAGGESLRSIAQRVSTDAELKKRVSQIADQWWKARQPCVFLSSAGKCTVYSARPATCLTHYLAADGDPKLCAADILEELPYLDSTPTKLPMLAYSASTIASIGADRLEFALHAGLAVAVLDVLWWLHSRRRKVAPSRKQMVALLEHLPIIDLTYDSAVGEALLDTPE